MLFVLQLYSEDTHTAVVKMRVIMDVVMKDDVKNAGKMTKRERVEATMKLQETDRVPVYDLLINDAAIEYFSGKYPPVGEKGIKAKCEAVGKMLDMTRAACYGPKEIGDWVDEDGFMRYRKERYINGGIRKRPFNDVEGAKIWLNKVTKRLKNRINNIDLKKYAKEHRVRFKQLQGYIGDDTVVLDECETGLDNVRAALGLELFSYISVDKKDLLSEYIELYTEFEIRKIHAVADRKLAVCAFVAGDVAMKSKLLHSPDWLRREFFPRVKRLNEAWHEHGIKCLFHSDGYIMEVMPDLLEAGIDGLNPVETTAGMDLKEVKRLYGNRIFITGGIDASQLLSNGNPDQVRSVCRETIKITSPGYFVGSTTELDNGAKLENILAILEVAWGRPPQRMDFPRR